MLLGASSLLEGQSPQQRESLLRYQDSLQEMPPALLRREMDTRRAQADSEATAMAHLRLGLAALSVGQRVDHYQLDRARGAFEQAARLEPDWPWPRYGIGLARRDDISRGDGRVAFLRRFWGNRDAWALREPGTRLLDHYSRLQYARRHFALEVNRRFYRFVDTYRSGSTELDDRGIVYVRQGPPEKRITVPIFGFFPNETWRYKRADGDLLLHFSSGGGQSGGHQIGGDLGDYHLIPSLLNAGTPGGATPAAGGDSVMLFVSRTPVTDLYAKYMTWGPEGRSRAIREEQRIVALSTTLATQTDADELTFDSALTVVSELIALGTNGNLTMVHVLAGIPVNVGTGSDQRLTTIRTSLGVFDSSGDPVASLDTAVILRLTGPVAPGSWAFTRAQVAVSPGHWTYRLAIEQGGDRGVVLPRATIAVPNLDGSRIAMSDLVIAPLPGSWPWPLASGDTVYASPLHTYGRGGRISLYYEVYGLKTGDYSTRISVYERKGAELGRRRLSLSFHSTARATVAREQRTIDLRDLQPGQYWLEVRAGEAVRKKAMTIVDTSK